MDLSGAGRTFSTRTTILLFLLAGMLLAVGCSASLMPVYFANGSKPTVMTFLPAGTNPTIFKSPVPCVVEHHRGYINVSPPADHYPGDIIVFNGTTNLPAGCPLELYVYTPSHSCEKEIYSCEDPDTVNHICCIGGFTRTVRVVPRWNGINTWSYTMNTSMHDFRHDEYVVFVQSADAYGAGIFTMLERPLPPALRPPWIAIDPVPDACPGDIISFRGTTNLPAGENLTIRIFGSRFNCTKCEPKNDSVDECCGDQIPLDVPILPGQDGINTWSREVNTSSHGFASRTYTLDVGSPSHGLYNSTKFRFSDVPNTTPFISIDPIPAHHLGDTIAFHGTTNLPPGEMIETGVYSSEFVPCPKSNGDCKGYVTPCCGGVFDHVSVIEGPCGANTWSWDVNTSEHGFRADGEYVISATGRNGAVGTSGIFTASGIPRPNLTLNLPENDTAGAVLRLSGRSNTGNGPDEKLLITLSSDSGKTAGFTVPVYPNGTGYSWNYTLNRSAIVPYNFLTVVVSSLASPYVTIQRTFLYNNEPAYYPYNPNGP